MTTDQEAPPPTETTPREPNRTGALVDVCVFIAIVAAVDRLSSLVIDEQSMLGGVIPLLTSFVLAWALLALRGSGWRDVGLRRPRPLWALPLWTALIVGVVYGSLTLVGYLMKQEPNVERFAPLEGNLALYLQAMLSVWVTAALFEELIYRGFLLSRLAILFGSSPVALFLANLAHATIFGLIHIYQGLAGVVMTGAVGFIFGAFYFLPRRNLWPLILAHGIVNSISFTRIFLFGVPGAG